MITQHEGCISYWGPARCHTRHRRPRLRNLATAQQMYFAGHASYSPSLEALTYSPSPGVRLEIIAASGTGWRAVARHEPAPPSAASASGPACPTATWNEK